MSARRSLVLGVLACVGEPRPGRSELGRRAGVRAT